MKRGVNKETLPKVLKIDFKSSAACGFASVELDYDRSKGAYSSLGVKPDGKGVMLSGSVSAVNVQKAIGIVSERPALALALLGG